MSLAMTAAPFEFDTHDNNLVRQKKQQMRQHSSQSNTNKTRKQPIKKVDETFIDDDKVNSVLASIHKGYSDENDEDNFMSNPTSEKASSKKIESMTNYEEIDGSVPIPLEKNEYELQMLEKNYMNDNEVENYYKKLIPGYQEMKRKTKKTSMDDYASTNPVIDKLNYIINLLEEQQDQRTNNVTEEVILYSFLGVFIIFVVDGFTRVGKYVR